MEIVMAFLYFGSFIMIGFGAALFWHGLEKDNTKTIIIGLILCLSSSSIIVMIREEYGWSIPLLHLFSQ